MSSRRAHWVNFLQLCSSTTNTLAAWRKFSRLGPARFFVGNLSNLPDTFRALAAWVYSDVVRNDALSWVSREVISEPLNTEEWFRRGPDTRRQHGHPVIISLSFNYIVGGFDIRMLGSPFIGGLSTCPFRHGAPVACCICPYVNFLMDSAAGRQVV